MFLLDAMLGVIVTSLLTLAPLYMPFVIVLTWYSIGEAFAKLNRHRPANRR
jgi:hypothetical protein